MPAVSRLLPAIVTKASLGSAPLSNGEIKMTYLVLKADLHVGPLGLRPVTLTR